MEGCQDLRGSCRGFGRKALHKRTLCEELWAQVNSPKDSTRQTFGLGILRQNQQHMNAYQEHTRKMQQKYPEANHDSTWFKHIQTHKHIEKRIQKRKTLQNYWPKAFLAISQAA